MEDGAKQFSGINSGTDHHKEKDPGSGYYKGHDQITEYLKGESPDRRAVKKLPPAPEYLHSISSNRGEH